MKLLILFGVFTFWLPLSTVNFLDYPDGIYLFKVNNGNNTTLYEICLKLTLKTPDFSQCSGVSIFDFKQVNGG